MKTLTVRMEILFGPEKGSHRGNIYFSGWHPMGKENGIFSRDYDVTTLLWFESRSIAWSITGGIRELKTNEKIGAETIFFEATVEGIDDNLATYITEQSAEGSICQPDKILDESSWMLVDKVLKSLRNRLNRFISYVRSFHGQYWVEEFKEDRFNRSRALSEFGAVFQFNDEKEFEFRVGNRSFATHAMHGSDGRMIRSDQWEDLKSFVSGEGRSLFALELLAGAEELANNGRDRVAITEAVAAMETAITAFGNACEKDVNRTWIRSERICRSSIPSEIRRIGLKKCLDHLFPLLFSEEDMPNEVLLKCRAGYEARNSVIHMSARSVKGIHELLVGIREFCRILLQFSLDSESPKFPVIDLDKRLTIEITMGPKREYVAPTLQDENSE